jgi:hypothetical protein
MLHDNVDVFREAQITVRILEHRHAAAVSERRAIR